jgi:hypothetical protein
MDPVSKLTPSPLVDALTNASLEVRRFKSEQAAQSLMNDSPPSTDSKKKTKAKQPGPLASSLFCALLMLNLMALIVPLITAGASLFFQFLS